MWNCLLADNSIPNPHCNWLHFIYFVRQKNGTGTSTCKSCLHWHGNRQQLYDRKSNFFIFNSSGLNSINELKCYLIRDSLIPAGTHWTDNYKLVYYVCWRYQYEKFICIISFYCLILSGKCNQTQSRILADVCISCGSDVDWCIERVVWNRRRSTFEPGFSSDRRTSTGTYIIGFHVCSVPSLKETSHLRKNNMF